MNTHHTPGDWIHVPRSRDGHADSITSHGRTFVSVGVPFAESPILDHPHENIQTANARLIAAAPELLSALERLSKAMDDYDGNIPADIESPYHQASLAILKATTPQ